MYAEDVHTHTGTLLVPRGYQVSDGFMTHVLHDPPKSLQTRLRAGNGGGDCFKSGFTRECQQCLGFFPSTINRRCSQVFAWRWPSCPHPPRGRRTQGDDWRWVQGSARGQQAILRDLEARHPGLTRTERDADGRMIFPTPKMPGTDGLTTPGGMRSAASPNACVPAYRPAPSRHSPATPRCQ